MSSAEWPVIVTEHALERALLRFPEIEPAKMIDAVVYEVYSALRSGRKAVRRPRALVGRGPRRRIENGRIVWSGDERRFYILRRIRDERGPAWVVLTCLARKEAA